MLVDLSEEFIYELSQRLQSLAESDKAFFNAHNYDVATLKNLLGQQDKYYYIYLDDNFNFAGYGMVRIWAGFDSPTIGCIVWPEYRKCGNGAKLVNQLSAKAKQLGFNKILLTVHKSNKEARKLYRSVGFHDTGDITPAGKLWMQRTIP